MTEKLKPCPFCGSEAKVLRVGSGRVVKCQGCGVSTSFMAENPAEVWNRRSAAKEPVAIITIDEEQLQRMVDEAVSTIIDCVELLAVADECDASDVDTDWAERIRKAVGE
nr:MAG TPA: restriction alleviation protein [Caudoviricetes sp.]